MLSRRELFTAGVAGSLTALPASAATAGEEIAQEADRAGQREIAGKIGAVEDVLRNAYLSSSLSHGFVSRIRAQMETFVRASAKFPDYIDIGFAVFVDVYDWHVKNRQQIVVARGADGRYQLQFMFTYLILRPEQDVSYVGIPYDKA